MVWSLIFPWMNSSFRQMVHVRSYCINPSSFPENRFIRQAEVYSCTSTELKDDKKAEHYAPPDFMPSSNINRKSGNPEKEITAPDLAV